MSKYSIHFFFYPNLSLKEIFSEAHFVAQLDTLVLSNFIQIAVILSVPIPSSVFGAMICSNNSSTTFDRFLLSGEQLFWS